MDKFPKDEVENLLKQINKCDDTEAFDRLVYLKTATLFKLAYSYLHDEKLAEDVVSEVFLEFIKRRGKFKDDRNLNGWMNVTAINKSLNIIKLRSRESLEENLKVEQASCPNLIIEQIHTKDCLAKLVEKERQVILLHNSGYTLDEISKIMRLSVNKIRRLLERAKENFKIFYKSL